MFAEWSLSSQSVKKRSIIRHSSLCLEGPSALLEGGEPSGQPGSRPLSRLAAASSDGRKGGSAMDFACTAGRARSLFRPPARPAGWLAAGLRLRSWEESWRKQSTPPRSLSPSTSLCFCVLLFSKFSSAVVRQSVSKQ
jgi:hypothetical protein